MSRLSTEQPTGTLAPRDPRASLRSLSNVADVHEPEEDFNVEETPLLESAQDPGA